ncbi:MAG: lysophospholipid acyltransferase family protein [Cyclobacteriaceae bacterium]|nr:lysophospholipid acyltransferase family protein [Cyclobacteriaceae bacterium]
MFFLKLLSYLPLSVHYLFADFLFFLAYYVVKYRRDIVWKNLLNSFPDKSEVELRQIERKFYKNLADTSVETLKLLTISEKGLLKRVKFDNSLTMKYHKLGYPVFGMTSHFCNWEWLLVAGSNQVGLKLHAAYQRLRNPFFNNLMIKIRSRFGVVLHEKNDVVKDVFKMKDESFLMSMVADQRPYSGEKKYWSIFLNQDAAFFSGSELLARRMDIKVIYASMKKVKRGHYEVCFLDIESSPKTSAPNEITEKFIQLAEKDIFNDPSSYLWSHDRWKHKKPTK